MAVLDSNNENFILDLVDLTMLIIKPIYFLCQA